MELSNEEYAALVRSKVKPSPLGRDLCWAFGVGGAVCALGQGLRELSIAPGAFYVIATFGHSHDRRVRHPHRPGRPAHRAGAV